jgi:hypothetical protein
MSEAPRKTMSSYRRAARLYEVKTRLYEVSGPRKASHRRATPRQSPDSRFSR